MVERRLERNWSVADPKYLMTEEVLDIGESQPYVITATENFVVTQNIQNMDEEYQHLLVYDLNTEDVWRTDSFGPTKEILHPLFFRTNRT